MKKRLASTLGSGWRELRSRRHGLYLGSAAVFLFYALSFNLLVNIETDYWRLVPLSLAGGLVLFLPLLALRKGVAFTYAFVMHAAISWTFLSQYFFYSYYGSFLQAASISFGRYAGDVMDVAGTKVHPRLLVFAAGLLFTAAILLANRRRPWYRATGVTTVFTATLLLALLVVPIAQEGAANRSLSALHGETTAPKHMVAKIGVGNYSAQSIARLLLRSDARAARGVDTSPLGQAGPFYTNSLRGIAKGRNLIMVEVESLEKWAVEAEIDSRPVMPFLSSLAADSLYFENHFFQTGASSTADAEFAALNGMYPLKNATVFMNRPGNTFFSLAHALKREGYSTGGYHAYHPWYWNRQEIYPKLGIDSYRAGSTNGGDFTGRHLGWGASDHTFFTQSIGFLKAAPQPFFGLLVTLSTHGPYENFSREYYDFGEVSGFTSSEAGYIQAAHYEDGALEQFMEELKEAGLYENSVIVIYGDHWVGGLGNKPNIAKALGAGPDDPVRFASLSQTPMLIHIPGSGIAARYTQPSSHADIFPTVAGLYGLSIPAHLTGRDAIATTEPVAAQRTSPRSIGIFMTDQLFYQVGEDGRFENGICLRWRIGKPVDIGGCRQEYEAQLKMFEFNDAVINANLLKDVEF